MTGRDRRAARTPLLAGVLLLIVGCSATSTSTPAAGSAAYAATPSATAAPASGAPPPASSEVTPTVVIDPTLLAYLPASIDGLTFTESPEAEAEALADPELASFGSAIAAAIAIDGSSGEFVYALVVRLLPGAMSQAAFGDWRAAYDEGACAQAGGVADTAETRFGGRTVYTGTCGGGVTTYHAWLDAQGILISASEVGERHLGKMLMSDVRDD